MSTIRKTLKDKDGNYICPAIPSRSIEGEDIKLGAVKAENIDFATLPGNYSLDEIDTGFTWVDGKKIYKKTIHVSNCPNSTEISLGNLLPANIFITKIEGTATAGTGVLAIGSVRPTNSTSVISARADQATGQVLISAGFDATNYAAYITFYYTKSS